MEWLDLFNKAAQQAGESKYAEALATLDELPPLLAGDASLTPQFFVMFELRRADLHSRLGQREAALKSFSDAMRIAFNDARDEAQVCAVFRRLTEAIRQWEDWQLLLDTGKQLMALAERHGYGIAQMEAGYHMPYAYRGLGDVARAKEYAEAIRSAILRSNCDPAQAEEWRSFLASLPTSA